MQLVNQTVLDEVLHRYQTHLDDTRPEEQYKWEAVKHFQDTYDPNAEYLAGMLRDALQEDEKINLLWGRTWFPIGMLTWFAEEDQDGTRAALDRLFDESLDLRGRMVDFEAWAKEELDKINAGKAARGESPAKSHFQDTRSMSVYLAYKMPGEHYLYKSNMYREAAKYLGIGYPGNKFDKVISYREMCGQILKRIEEAHQSLIEASDAMLRESDAGDLTVYDPAHHMLVQDVVYYITTYDKDYRDKPTPIGKQQNDGWFPSKKDYDPGLSVEEWASLLTDKEVFTPDSLAIMARLLDFGGEATCTQLARKYGETKNYYNAGSSWLARRVHKRTGCPAMDRESENSRWWPILYVGRPADEDAEGSYVWKLRDELREALESTDLSAVKLYPEPKDKHGYWWLNANPSIWSYSNISVGEVETYTLYNEKGNKRRIHQNFLDARAGDPIVGYASSPIRKIVALGRITAEQDGEFLYFEKTQDLENPVEYADIQSCPALANMEYLSNPQGSLFRLTEDEYEAILELAGVEDVPEGEDPAVEDVEKPAPYSKEDFLADVYMSEDRYDRLEALLRRKKNVILQGAPGTGKTFCARRLAWSMMGCRDDSRVEMVQFHQSYSYEDFMMGWRPEGEGFKLRYGLFHRFCTRAANHPDQDYFFIIDEINRGNLSKVFGELLMLVEADHRGEQVTLAYDGQPFSVPGNLYIIGMMNTADRSLTGIDYALRRRFSFFEMEPAFGSAGFRAYQESLESEELDALVDQLVALNAAIAADPTLGRGYRIGHSYLCGQGEADDEWLQGVVEYDIAPMLEEYWFDDLDKARHWEGLLLGALSQ